MPPPYIPFFPFTAVIDLHDMTVIDRDISETDVMSLQDVRSALDQANSH